MAEITREHLELAALAAGKNVLSWTDRGVPIVDEHNGVSGMFLWRPHLDDGDAARLAVRLRMDIRWGADWVAALRGQIDVIRSHDGTEPDKLRAWREAVVLCAAADGERMQKGGAS